MARSRREVQASRHARSACQARPADIAFAISGHCALAQRCTVAPIPAAEYSTSRRLSHDDVSKQTEVPHRRVRLRKCSSTAYPAHHDASYRSDESSRRAISVHVLVLTVTAHVHHHRSSQRARAQYQYKLIGVAQWHELSALRPAARVCSSISLLFFVLFLCLV